MKKHLKHGLNFLNRIWGKVFVSLYRRFRDNSFIECKRITNEAITIYRGCRAGKQIKLIKQREDNLIEIVELGFYHSMKKYVQITQALEKDKRIGQPFKKFLIIVQRDKISEEKFETISPV